jgi:hypothetical protein
MEENQYFRVEFIVDTKRLGTGFAFGKEVDPGQTLVDVRGLSGKRAELLLMRREAQKSGESCFTKNCIANQVPGLRQATTIVHIPTIDVNGERLDAERWNALFMQACAIYGVPIWTQSSIKHTTFYMVEHSMFNCLADAWNREDMGHRFAAYAGLMFSEITDIEPLEFTITEVLGEGAENDGVDGNCLVSKDIWGNTSMQFRGWRWSKKLYTWKDPNTGIVYRFHVPVAYVKGMGYPVSYVKGMQLNTSQIKMGAAAGKYYILRNKSLNGRLTRQWISAEPIILLKNNRTVRRFLMRRVMNEVTKLLSYLTEERRTDLLFMLQGLTIEDDELQPALQAVIDMLRSNMPWCAEMEERLTRFMMRLIVRKIVPSGGIYGWAAPLIISEGYGVAPCSWDEAVCFAIRIPTTGAPAIVPLPKDPYKQNLGHVVTAEVALLVSGDGDGDLLVLVYDGHLVDLFRKHLNRALVGGLKPVKRKIVSDLSTEILQDVAMHQVSNAWMVGTLTTKAWALIEARKFKAASVFLEAANIEPMTYKHHITFSGKDFHQYVYDLLGKYKDFEWELVWRDKIQESEDWQSIREMSNHMIVKPKGLIGFLWNAGVAAVGKWNRKYPMQQLSLSKLQRVIFADTGRSIPGAVWRKVRSLVEKWGLFWTNSIDADGRVIATDDAVDKLYAEVRQWGKEATTLELAALMSWRPKQGDGFALKMNVVFANGRGPELLGYHPDVEAYIKKRTGKQVPGPALAIMGESPKPRIIAKSA